MTRIWEECQPLAALYRYALVVDDDNTFLNTLCRQLKRCGVVRVERTQSLAQARELLTEEVDLLITDLCLAGNSGERLIREARQMIEPPTVIAISGAASRQQVFDLSADGVTAFLEKPFTVPQLRECLSRASDASRVLTEVARTHVGKVGVREAQHLVRSTMYREALTLTDGNRRAAARLLKVDRRLVQLMANELEPDDAGPSDDTPTGA